MHLYVETVYEKAEKYTTLDVKKRQRGHADDVGGGKDSTSVIGGEA